VNFVQRSLLRAQNLVTINDRTSPACVIYIGSDSITHLDDIRRKRVLQVADDIRLLNRSHSWSQSHYKTVRHHCK